MNIHYIHEWMQKILKVERLVKSRINGKDNESRPTQWEVRKLNEMKQRLSKDRYMYFSYQQMLYEWSRPARSSYWRRNFVGLHSDMKPFVTTHTRN